MFLILIVSGCAKEKTQTALPAPEREMTRIISTAPSNTEIIAGLGLADRLVACDRYSLSVPGVNAALPEIDFFYPDVEAVIGLEPDIIISSEVNNFGAAGSPFKPLADMNIETVLIPTAVSIADIYGGIRRIALALNVPEQGETLVAAMKSEVDAAAERGRAVTHKARVYFEAASYPSMVSFGSGVYLNEMIEISGAENVFAGVKGWFSPGAEAVISANPEVILVFSDSPDNTAEAFAKRPGFAGIDAVKNNRVYAIDADSASRPSQHITKALAQMARAVYPETGEENESGK
ncbi:MAG: ABC transporter substrate-binding protein [Treponematales bacterium]